MYTGLNAEETVIYTVLVALRDQLAQRLIAQLIVGVCLGAGIAAIGLIGLVATRRIALRSSK